MVPFERNTSFTSRESELKRLRQALFTRNRTAKVAITGLGAIGKTQLALELVYRIRAEHKNCSVIWIPATNKESLEQAYLNAAGQLGISGCEEEKANIKRILRDYLSSESAGQWLLVFDNADDIGIWVNKSTPESDRLIDYLPKSSHGSIIFTTPDKKTAVRLAGRNVVEILEMDEASSRQLLENCLFGQGLLRSQGDATALLARLTYLPLAIVQAAAYINTNGIRVGDYLSLLEEQEEDIIDLLSEDFEDEGRYRDLKNPVATTWLISFEQIRKHDPLAADYLSLMACVDAKNIPQSLFPPGQSRKKETDAIGTLQGYSFIAKQSASSAINIHRLVHLAIRNWLRTEGLLPDWTDRAIARLVEMLEDVGHNNRVTWKSYMPHVNYALSVRHTGENDREGLYLLWKYGLCLYCDGRHREAEAPFEQVMETRKTKLGADHPDKLTSMAYLASTYRNQGRWAEAEELQAIELEICTKVLGPRHPDTLVSMKNLAFIWKDRGRHGDALGLMQTRFDLRQQILGVGHPYTVSTLSTLKAWRGESDQLPVQES